MSVQYQPTQVTYVSDGINPTFSFLFKAQAADWIEVSIYNPDADPLIDAQVIPPSNYGVTLNPTEGGSITFTGAVPADGFEITIRLNADFTQELELDNSSPISLTQIEKSLDRLTMFCLQIKNELTRTVKLPYWFGQPPSDEPLVIEQPIDNRCLIWQDGRIVNSLIDFTDYYTKDELDDLLAANLLAANDYTDDGLVLKADLEHTHILADILQSGATDGQVMTWDDLLGEWIAASPITGVTDHGLLTGLADDDHTQYHNDTRGDARYYTQAQVDTFLSGKANSAHTHPLADLTQSAATSGQVATWSGTAWVPQTPVTGVSDHGGLTGLADDDHTQYHNDTRGDARYYTQSQVTTFLSGKANTVHTHDPVDIVDANNGLSKSVGATDSGSGGVINAMVYPMLARAAHVSYWFPNAILTTATQAGMPTFVGQGTATTKSPDSTLFKLASAVARIAWVVSTAATSAIACWRFNANTYYVCAGGGSYYAGLTAMFMFGPERGQAASTAGTLRAFAGFTNSAAAASDANPSAATASIVGVGCDSTDTNYQIIYRASSGAGAIKVDTGIPKAFSDDDKIFQLILENDRLGGGMKVIFRELGYASYNNVFTYTIPAGGLPANSVLMSPRAYYSVGGTNSVIGINMFKFYSEQYFSGYGYL